MDRPSNSSTAPIAPVRAQGRRAHQRGRREHQLAVSNPSFRDQIRDQMHLLGREQKIARNRPIGCLGRRFIAGRKALVKSVAKWYSPPMAGRGRASCRDPMKRGPCTFRPRDREMFGNRETPRSTNTHYCNGARYVRSPTCGNSRLRLRRKASRECVRH